MQPPATRYATREDGVSIAYQVVGDGPVDLLYSPGFISHLDLQWTDPGFARFLNRLAGFSRLILYDKPGTGLSDPIAQLPTLEERTQDMITVLDAAGCERASVLAFSEGGPASVLLAATQPDRIRSLVLYGTFSAMPGAFTPEDLETLGPEKVSALVRIGTQLQDAIEHWGEGRAIDLFAPTVTSDIRRRFYATFERTAASPRMARALVASGAMIDVRGALSSVHCPVLVLHRRDDRMVPAWAGEKLAEEIPNARYLELAGEDHAFWFGDFDDILGEIERFLTGSAAATAPRRALATVLFTDVVGSTERAAALGDRAWREVLERHDELARATVDQHGGRIVKHMGDGLLATFGGPGRAVECAEGLISGVEPLGIQLRVGIHTGEVELMGYAAGEERAPVSQPLDAAAEHMRASDRLAVTLARRAPRMMRLGARVMMRS